jgi:hypothetical protein
MRDSVRQDAIKDLFAKTEEMHCMIADTVCEAVLFVAPWERVFKGKCHDLCVCVDP